MHSPLDTVKASVKRFQQVIFPKLSSTLQMFSSLTNLLFTYDLKPPRPLSLIKSSPANSRVIGRKKPTFWDPSLSPSSDPHPCPHHYIPISIPIIRFPCLLPTIDLQLSQSSDRQLCPNYQIPLSVTTIRSPTVPIIRSPSLSQLSDPPVCYHH